VLLNDVDFSYRNQVQKQHKTTFVTAQVKDKTTSEGRFAKKGAKLSGLCVIGK
jgi:hypothetical protein